jgi:phosphoribosylformylglycinamidine cyclo-ligase
MGHRMEIYCNPAVAQDLIELSESFGVPAQIVGRVEASDTGKRLTITSDKGTFTY